jgi:UDP-N-acetylmuramoyl-L-alanyl-D-glutamate--2,6-diaminopimelate ligase
MMRGAWSEVANRRQRPYYEQMKAPLLIPLPLRELLAGLADPGEHGDLRVTGITDDSRTVRPGDLFVAVAGLTVDGHDFARRAVAAGAVAVVGSRAVPSCAAPSIVVDSPPRVLGIGAARLHGTPAAQLSLVGITGTNGKTTTSYLVESILAADGQRPGVVGTIAYRFAGAERQAAYTTPTAVALQRLLAEMVEARCTHVVIEVSSHALQLERIWGCPFAVAAFF